MKTIIIIQGKNLKDISTINRKVIDLLGTLRTETTNFFGYLIYSGILSEEEKSKLSEKFGDNYIISFVETENIIKSEKIYISSKM